jgi:hypothetical protein
VFVARDIMCSGYVAGGNTRFFGAAKNANLADTPITVEEVRTDLEARLSFQDDAEGEYGSMLAFCAPYGDGAKRDQVISITDRLLPWEVGRPGGEKEYFPGGSDNYKSVMNVLGLNTIHFGEDVRASENMEFISQGSMNNGLCFVGPHRKYNPFSNQYHELVPGQGHFGPDAIPGDVSLHLCFNTNPTHILCMNLTLCVVVCTGALATRGGGVAQERPRLDGLAGVGGALANVHDQGAVMNEKDSGAEWEWTGVGGSVCAGERHSRNCLRTARSKDNGGA